VAKVVTASATVVPTSTRRLAGFAIRRTGDGEGSAGNSVQGPVR
jgi:hypothetical protein